MLVPGWTPLRIAWPPAATRTVTDTRSPLGSPTKVRPAASVWTAEEGTRGPVVSGTIVRRIDTATSRPAEAGSGQSTPRQIEPEEPRISAIIKPWSVVMILARRTSIERPSGNIATPATPSATPSGGEAPSFTVNSGTDVNSSSSGAPPLTGAPTATSSAQRKVGPSSTSAGIIRRSPSRILPLGVTWMRSCHARTAVLVAAENSELVPSTLRPCRARNPFSAWTSRPSSPSARSRNAGTADGTTTIGRSSSRRTTSPSANGPDGTIWVTIPLRGA